MKKIFCILLATMLLLLTGCGTKAALDDLPPAEETTAAVDVSLVNVFGTPGDAALAELGLQDAPYNEDLGGMVAEYEWCGEKLQTVINPDWTGTGEVVSIRARTAHDAAEISAMKRYVECFTAQFGVPVNYSTEISGEGRFGHSYDEAALEEIITAFVETDADSALNFRFMLPERTEEDLEFAECAFYKTMGSDTVDVSLHMLRISELDYEIVD